MLTRFYEYESKLSNLYGYAKKLELKLNKFHLDTEDKWDESRLSRVDETDVYKRQPVRYVVIYVKDGENLVLEAKFDKSRLQLIDFKGEKASGIIKKLRM